MITPPQHGGRLQAAANLFNIPVSDWLDLSTGINPINWQVPDIPQHIWQRLPDSYEPLETAATDYYGAPVFAIPGSQWAIQMLPTILQTGRVWLPKEAYEEHQYWWLLHGHDVLLYESLTAITPDQYDAVVIINPNNPTGKTESVTDIIDLATRLQSLQGHMILDEAFMDPTPQKSVFAQVQTLPECLIVLRSMGKFFGLAGLRLGFVHCNEHIKQKLLQRLGPWAVSNPAAYVGELALRDKHWHQSAREQLQESRIKLQELLQRQVPAISLQSTHLFCTLQLTDTNALSLYNHCAEHGILLRHFPQWGKIRVGLTTKSGMARLKSALKCWDI